MPLDEGCPSTTRDVIAGASLEPDRGGVRPGWLAATVRELQLVAGLPSANPPVQDREQLRAFFTKQIPAPTSRLESYVLTGLFVEAEQRLAYGSARHRVSADPAHQAAVTLANRFAEKWTVPRLSRAVGRNRSQLSVEFQRAFGVSIHVYLTMRRIEQAQTLLMATTLKVEAIGRAIGYQSKKAFFEAFRRITKTTPAAYRRRE